VAFYYRVRKCRAKIGAAEGLVQLSNLRKDGNVQLQPRKSAKKNAKKCAGVVVLAGETTTKARQGDARVNDDGNLALQPFVSSQTTRVKRPRRRSSKLKHALKEVEEAQNHESLKNAVMSIASPASARAFSTSGAVISAPQCGTESDSSAVSSSSCSSVPELAGKTNKRPSPSDESARDVAKGLMQLAASINDGPAGKHLEKLRAHHKSEGNASALPSSPEFCTSTRSCDDIESDVFLMVHARNLMAISAIPTSNFVLC
jgi:hypothetical protein